MKITSFKLGNPKRNWHLEETVFDNFNLLVGISGVGKTRIIKTIQDVCQMAIGHHQSQEVMNWTIGFVHAEQEYEWELRTSLITQDFVEVNGSEQLFITYERILQKAGNKKIVLLERSEKVNQLDGKELPKLKKTESAINLLSEEASIAPIYEGFNQFIFSETRQEQHTTSRVIPDKNNVKQQMLFGDFKEKSTQLPTVVKAYWLQERYPSEFKQIKNDFSKIFPSIEDLKVSVIRKKEVYEFSFQIKENNEWIPQSQISSGMFRTLVHLINIFLAPTGTVIVIDEFENSLGINCMSSMTDFVISKAPLMQFILASHHPYIINNIPWKTWKLVTRKGGYVKVTNATKIPNLQTTSSMERFFQLINIPEYEDGIL